jgi:phosphoglucomutase
MGTDLGRILERAWASDALSSEALANLEVWLSDPTLAEFGAEIADLVERRDWDELEDAFYTHLTVGTGGIRGRLGPGPNRINTRTIGEAAQGLSRFIEGYSEENVGRRKEAGIVVGHEARRNSRTFAEMCCEVFAANGIRSFLFDGIRSTPELSFAVRFLGATAGVQITASHNPRTDNGFKFYWSDGGQVVPPHDAKFMELVEAVTTIDRLPLSDARREGLVSIVGEDVDREYLSAVRTLSLDTSRSARVVFSPIHGAGSTNVLPVLEAEGFEVIAVADQLAPDPEFPLAAGDLINPEYREVMELPIRLGELTGADVAICSDPDADRIGVAARLAPDESSMLFLRGDQVGAALTEYILRRRRARSALPRRHLVLETLVTTSLIGDVARSFDVQVLDDLLVGYKFIAERIEKLEDPTDFVFSAEESLGYLAGTFVRDKDAAIAALLVAEMASWLKDRGLTIPMFLDELYQKYGYYKNVQFLVELPGKSGRAIMTAIMGRLREAPPDRLAGRQVLECRDRLDDAMRASYRLGLVGDILTFVLSGDGRTRITVRPSGTEPKLKFYMQVHAPVSPDLATAKREADAAAERIVRALVDYCVGMRRGPGDEPDPEALPSELRADWLSAGTRWV